jgi:hypothetical protein
MVNFLDKFIYHTKVIKFENGEKPCYSCKYTQEIQFLENKVKVDKFLVSMVVFQIIIKYHELQIH